MRIRTVTPETLEARFRASFQQGQPDECWLWRRKKLPTGYGLILVVRGQQVYAHRLAYQLAKGEIPAGLFVCHSCDTPSCVNPAHLWLGTPKENTRDMFHKGRQYTGPRLRGEASPCALLTDDAVREIRRRRAQGESTLMLAEAFGVNHRTISVAAIGKNWSHITDVPPLPSLRKAA